MLTSLVEEAEARVEAGDSVAAAGKKRSSPARCCFPGSGEEAKRELVLWRFHSRTEEAPAALVAAVRWCSSCSHGGVLMFFREFSSEEKEEAWLGFLWRGRIGGGVYSSRERGARAAPGGFL